MGAYLNKPVVEKESESGSGSGLTYGATCMQGWRVNQEDAHNCVISLAGDWSLFAVYDGHGGSEVAKYTAEHFPEFLKTREFWKSDDIDESLKKIFIDFDDVLRSEDVMKELKKISNEGKERPPRDEGHDSEDEADRIQTIEESRLPIEELLAKYGYSVIRKGGNGNGTKSIVQSLVDAANEVKEDTEDCDDSDEGTADCKKDKKKRPCKSPSIEKAKRAKTDSSAPDATATESCGAEPVVTSTTDDASAPAAGDEANTDGDSKPDGVEAAGSAEALEKKEKATTEEGEGDSSDDDSSFDEAVEGEDEEMDEDDDEAEDEEIYIPGGGEVPGDDSGTTACVCLISKDKVVVANAGDSRAILSRAGVAIDLSVDHKPEDEIEKNRIEKAGGMVNEDGRVNGGLNLSRAFGDHCYKKNTELPLAEQMISALPDIKIETLQKEDEFLVVACDGIWNSMESQQVIDFVKEKLAAGRNCQQVAEDLCDACLADSTQGDGTGCDNMTVIVTQIAH